MDFLGNSKRFVTVAMAGTQLPSLAELQMHGRHLKEAIDEQPTPIRASWYLGPSGGLASGCPR